MAPGLFVQARAAFEKRVKEQIERHRSVDPNANTRKIVELTFRLENDRLKKRLERLLEADDLSGDDEVEILMLQYMINDLLPELERTF